MSRVAELAALASKRASARPVGYKNIGEYHNGIYECDFVSPYSKVAHNHESPIFVLLQDWISDDVLSGPVLADAVTLGRIPKLPTNRNLDRFLREHFGIDVSETYATNLFPFIKPGGMSGAIPLKDLCMAAREYALPQIQIIKPMLVIALGLNCFNALRFASASQKNRNIAEAIASPFAVGPSMIWCQAHPGALGQNGRNKLDARQVEADWSAMAAWYKRNPQS